MPAYGLALRNQHIDLDLGVSSLCITSCALLRMTDLE